MSSGSYGPPAEVDGLGIDVTVVPDGGRHRGHLLGRRAELQHVSLGHERELDGGEHPVPDHEFVGRTGPGGGRGPLGVHARAPTHDQHHPALPGGDQRRRLQHGRDPQSVHGAPARAQAQFVGELAGALTDHRVDVGRLQPGIAEGAERPLYADGHRIVAGQDAGLRGVEDAGDGHVAERVGHMR